jgi:hypothetical protein
MDERKLRLMIAARGNTKQLFVETKGWAKNKTFVYSSDDEE